MPGMIIVHAMNNLPRIVHAALIERLQVMPAVVVSGARQTGKSTLVGELLPGPREYRTLDDMDTLHAARKDPGVLFQGRTPVTIDEVQRAPELLAAVKLAIDRDRTPGRFLLTGSANLLLMQRVSETLAGRASHLSLWPMTRAEQAGHGTAGAWDELLAAHDDTWLELIGARKSVNEDWQSLALRGGFPTPALALKTRSERGLWFDGYERTYLERDLQSLSAISALPDFRRFMRAAALRTGQLINQTELARDLGLPQPTVHRWLNLLEASCIAMRVPAFSVNRTKRLIKSPKLYWADTGLALHLSGHRTPGGEHLENLVLADLLAWKEARPERTEVTYWRTAGGEEVDFVIESGGKFLPVEVKSTTKPRLADAAHLRSFREEHGKSARAGLLLHGGTMLKWMAPGVLAAPWWRVL